MTIEILDIQTKTNLGGNTPLSRYVSFIISDGIDAFFWGVGGLPLAGNLQDILDSQETTLFQAAQAKGKTFDIFEVTERRVLKALTLVILDEINLLRQQHGLPDRSESQIRGAIKSKL